MPAKIQQQVQVEAELWEATHRSQQRRTTRALAAGGGRRRRRTGPAAAIGNVHQPAFPALTLPPERCGPRPPLPLPRPAPRPWPPAAGASAALLNCCTAPGAARSSCCSRGRPLRPTRLSCEAMRFFRAPQSAESGADGCTSVNFVRLRDPLRVGVAWHTAAASGPSPLAGRSELLKQAVLFFALPLHHASQPLPLHLVCQLASIRVAVSEIGWGKAWRRKTRCGQEQPRTKRRVLGLAG